MTLSGALSRDTTVKWTPVAGAAGYRVQWRRTDTDRWTDHVDVAGQATAETVLKGVVVDDNFVGVSALGATGAESLVTFGGRGAGRGR